MTTPSPRDVWYEYDAQLYAPATGQYHPLDVVSFMPSADMDRVPFTAARIVVARPSAAAWAAMDPRVSIPPYVTFQVRQRAVNDAGVEYTVETLPRTDIGPDYAWLRVRSATRNWITREVSLDVQGQEALMDDKRRIATTTINTAATTVGGLVLWSLNDVFGGVSVIEGPAMATALPAGDRRLMLPGESHSDLVEPELDALGYRLYDQWGRVWHSIDRAAAPKYPGAPSMVKLGAFTSDVDDTLPSDVDPIVTAVTETVDRDGDWADGILVKGSWWNGTTRTEWAQASTGGVNTKGRVINVERAQPASNLANAYKARTQIRGHSIDVTARARFDVLPSMDAQIHLRGGTILDGSIRAVEWDIPTGKSPGPDSGRMALRIQTGDPL